MWGHFWLKQLPLSLSAGWPGMGLFPRDTLSGTWQAKAGFQETRTFEHWGKYVYRILLSPKCPLCPSAKLCPGGAPIQSGSIREGLSETWDCQHTWFLLPFSPFTREIIPSIQQDDLPIVCIVNFNIQMRWGWFSGPDSSSLTFSNCSSSRGLPHCKFILPLESASNASHLYLLCLHLPSSSCHSTASPLFLQRPNAWRMNWVFFTLTPTPIYSGCSELHHWLPREDSATGTGHLEPLMNIPATVLKWLAQAQPSRPNTACLSFKLQICFAKAKFLDVLL